MSFKKNKLKRIFGGVFTVILAVSMCMPVAADTGNANANTASVAEKVNELLSAGKYTEGRAIAVVSESAASDGILSGAVKIATVSEKAYEEYAAYNQEAVTAEVSGDLKVVFVSDSSLSTRDLLTQLLSDKDVIIAEPDYIYSTEDEETSENGEDADATGTKSGDVTEEGSTSGEGTEEAEDGTGDNGTSDNGTGDASADSGSSSDGENKDASDGSSSSDTSADNGNGVTDSKSGSQDNEENGIDDETVIVPENTDTDNSKKEDKKSSDTDKSSKDTKKTTDDKSKNTSEKTEKLSEGLAVAANTQSVWTKEACADATFFQWAHNNNGTLFKNLTKGSLFDFDMYTENWNSARSNATGVIALIDTGVDYTNPDLSGVMMSNMQNYNTAGGAYGYNAVDENPADAMDQTGHGTHCAGTIAASWNVQGTSGAASGVSLVSCKATKEDGTDITAVAVIKCYEYLRTAVNNGLSLVAVNNSWGPGGVSSDAINLMAVELGEKGAVSVFASGNSNQSHDSLVQATDFVRYNPYTVTVDAASYDGTKSDFSDYGSYSTDVFAPGTYILSTVRTEQATYLPELDGNPIFGDDFNGETVIKVTNQTEVPNSEDDIVDAEGVTRSSEIGYENKDSLELSLYSFDKYEDGRAFVMYVPVEENKAASIDTVSFYMTSDTPTSVNLKVYLKTGDTYQWTDLDEVTSDAAGFTRVTADFSSLISSGSSIACVPSAEENMVLVPVMVVASGNGNLYMDCFRLSNHEAKAPYAYMSGTSMAASLVSGCTGIIAKTQSENGENIFSAGSAKERANIIKASVTDYQAFDGKCRQNGMLDMSVSSGEYTPVINKVTCDTDKNTITIEGAYFGNGGSVSVDGTSMAAVSWSNSSVVLSIPSDIASGFKTLSVTAANGKKTTGAFVLSEAEEPVEEEITANKIDLAPSLDKDSKGGVTDEKAAIAAVGDIPSEIYKDALLGTKAEKSSLVSDGYITAEEYQKVLDYVQAGGAIRSFDIRTTVLDADEVPEADKALLDELTEYTQAHYWDVSIYLNGDKNEHVAKLNKLTDTIKISVLMDGSLIVSNRSFRTYKIHDGALSTMKATIGAKSYLLSFETSEFSTYALLYKDVTPTITPTATPTDTPTISPAPSSSKKSSGSSSSKSGSTASTGDANNMAPFGIIIAVAVVVIIIAAVLYRRKKK